jgi:hypothetical protein
MSRTTASAADVLSPSAPASRRAYVDFVFGLDYLSVNSRLLRLMHQAMSAYGLSCLLVNRNNLDQTRAAVRKKRLRPLVYLDLSSRPGDPFHGLLEEMAGKGVHTFCDPKALLWTLKAYAHERLVQAGLPLPPSVVIPRTEADRDLTPEERSRVGERCVIKPSFGVAGLGVVVGVPPERDQIAKARNYDRNEDWLVQRMIKWSHLGDRQAYLRGYNVLGHRTLMWWSNDRGYESLTWDDFRRYDLHGAVDLIDQVARVTGVEYFSSEIAICDDGDAGGAGGANVGRFCLIDYVNDQCDIDPQADPNRSPPEAWVRWVCHRFAEFTWRKKHNLPTAGEGTLYLAE